MILLDNKIQALRDFRDTLGQIIKTKIEQDTSIIIDMNANRQLYQQGINSEGEDIMSYAPYRAKTIKIKLTKGQPTDRVTLRDTGDFHTSFEVVADETQFKIDATDWKAQELVAKYGKEILGLTEEHVHELIWQYLYPKLITELNNRL